MNYRGIAGVAVIVMALAGCGKGDAPAAPPTPASMNITGTLTLRTTSIGTGSADLPTDGSPCYGTGGYSDIADGAQVTVTDAAGKVVGLGKLSAGAYQTDSCVFPFTVSGVVSGSQFYGIEVTHRGAVRYQGAAVKSPALTLGDGT